MNTELAKNEAMLKDLKPFEMLQAMLNAPPNEKFIKVNALARNAKFLSINHIERLLDEFFVGLWSVENFNYQVVTNEICGVVTLSVKHPISGEWLKRQGAAAVQIMTKKGENPYDLANKIPNCLGTIIPRLKSDCIKNAAKGLGNVFGRNLNRDDDGEFEFLEDKVENFAQKEQDKSERELIVELCNRLIDSNVKIATPSEKAKYKEQNKIRDLQKLKVWTNDMLLAQHNETISIWSIETLTELLNSL